MSVRFKQWDCVVRIGEYAMGGLAIMLFTHNGQKVATCTVNLAGEAPPLKDNEVFIKDWAENEGMLKTLVDAGIVKDTGDVMPTGFVEANLCEYIGDLQ